MKDNFSTSSDKYLKYRPQYPHRLIELIVSNCENQDRAWDVGTGNGQMASLITNYFREVHATDISENQLVNSIQTPTLTTQCSQQTLNKFSSMTRM
ncbi:MAG: class I SAM-dependent methyltransferase [Cytophagales bacterium]|nr:class I SAM-dependent methyltransferase [Cytophagales bacterium]